MLCLKLPQPLGILTIYLLPLKFKRLYLTRRGVVPQNPVGPLHLFWTSSIIDFKFLSCCVHSRHLCAICTIFLCICGNQIFWQRSSMAAEPGCVRCRLSSTVCLRSVGRTMRSSTKRQSSLTCSRFRIRQYQYPPNDSLSASQCRFFYEVDKRS